MRILLVAAAPALDRVAVVEDAARGGTLRALRAAEAPGGKAIHAARAAAALGGDVQLLLAVAGGAGDRLLRALRQERLPAVAVRLAAGETRSTFTVVDASEGDVLEVLEPPPALAPAEADRLARRAASLARASGIVSFGGSLPPGAPTDLVARIVRAARRAGAFCAVDTSGEALAAAVAEGPDLVKPNLAEAAVLLGAPQDSPEDGRGPHPRARGAGGAADGRRAGGGARRRRARRAADASAGPAPRQRGRLRRRAARRDARAPGRW